MNLGMPEETFVAFMDYQIMTDYLLSNVDRHMNNIAIVRNPDTLELKGFAPIYDSGNSMFYNIPYEQIDKVHLDDIKTHSFLEKEVRLLSYVQNRKAVDLDKVEMNFGIYEKDLSEHQIRIPKLQELYNKKVAKLRAFQEGKDIWKTDRY
jgi:hypothetical protein